MQIFVKTWRGTTMAANVAPSETVHQLKKYIQVQDTILKGVR